MLVKEFIENHKYDYRNFWLCPNIVVDQPITAREFECGMEFGGAAYVPDALLVREVHKTWREGDTACVIWKNN